MIGFAVMDVLVSITHLILMPGIQLTSVGSIFFGYHMVNMPPVVGTWASILCVVFFYQTFIILAFHYVYRYAVVCEPRWSKLFTKHTTVWWTLISTCAQLLYTCGFLEAVQIGFMPSEYKTAHYHAGILANTGIDNEKVDFGYLAIIFRKPNTADPSEGEICQMDSIIAILIAISLFGLTAIVIVICITLILLHLRISESSLVSALRRKTQHALLKALIIQTVIPTIFSYIPLGMIFLMPFLGFNLSGFYGDIMAMTTAIFPAIDPIIMLYFVRSYRTRVDFIWKVLTNPGMTQVEYLNGSTMSGAAEPDT